MADNSDPAPLAQPEPPTAELPDSELVARARAGSEEAFEDLFKRHRRRVALICGRFFRRREQIEEVVQESFMKAYFALADFSNQREASFAAWIARITYNSCYDELRRVSRRNESALGEISEDEAAWLKEQLGRGHVDLESAAVARDLSRKLLSRLSPEDRLVLVMLDAEGLSVAEIAKLLGWSASKVKVRAHRARASLRRVLKRFL